MATERWIFGILYLVACVQTEEFEEAPDLPADDGLSMIMYLLWIITLYIMNSIVVYKYYLFWFCYIIKNTTLSVSMRLHRQVYNRKKVLKLWYGF